MLQGTHHKENELEDTHPSYNTGVQQIFGKQMDDSTHIAVKVSVRL